MISRDNNYKKKGGGGVLIKLSKYNQNNLLDIPTIGIQTVKNICKYNYEGIFLEKNNCIVLNKNEVIDYSNKHNIFISTINKIEQ